jgi:hypothetical protein
LELTSTVERVHVDVDRGRPKRCWLYGVTTMSLVVIVGLAVIDGFGVVDVVGVDTSRVSATGGGFDLEVRYGTVTRPALATPFEIVVARPGGFDGPVTVGVSRDYLAMWDENGLFPAPSTETSLGSLVVWEFDPPPGEVLTVTFDARIEPSAQSGQDGTVAVLQDDRPVVEVGFHTAVRP